MEDNIYETGIHRITGKRIANTELNAVLENELSMKYAFPGNVALDVIDTDCDGTEKDVCRMTEK